MRKSTISESSYPVTFDSLSDDEKARIYESRAVAYNQLIKLQFQLCYHANISIKDLDAMTKYEYMQFYNELYLQRQAEKEASEELRRKASNHGTK